MEWLLLIRMHKDFPFDSLAIEIVKNEPFVFHNISTTTHLVIIILWFSFVFNDARLQESFQITQKYYEYEFYKCICRYPCPVSKNKWNIQSLPTIVLCTKDCAPLLFIFAETFQLSLAIYNHYYTLKRKRTCTYIPFELLGILFSLQIKHIMQSTTTMSYHSIFCF